jgi:hypothetical protein
VRHSRSRYQCYNNVRPETELSFHEVENNTGWKGFVTYWILLVVICASVIAGFYHLFPTHLEIQVTREFQFLMVLTLACVILLSVIWKICSNKVQITTEHPKSPVVSIARRQSQLHSSSSVDSETNSSQEIPAGNSFVNISHKHTFKGDGTAIWSEFMRYFENVANLN